MELLKEAIKAAGGVSALARRLGVKPNTVSNWQVRGLPRAYAYLFRFMREEGTGLFVTDVSHTESIGTNAANSR